MRRIRECINPKLAEICQKSLNFVDVSAKVLPFLPESLQNVCSVGSFNKGCLNLVVRDAVWASQLRYQLPELRDRLRSIAGLYQLASIKITVAVEENCVKPNKIKPNLLLSEKAKNCIIKNANDCSYPPLKQALQRLARSEE